MAIDPAPRACSPAGCSASNTGDVFRTGGQYGRNTKYVLTGAQQIADVAAGKNCLESVAQAAGYAVAWDPVDGGCWGITGLRVPIADTYATVHSFAEIVNANFGVNASQRSVLTQYVLPGSYQKAAVV